MNLHNIVRGAIASVNPEVAAGLYQNIGYKSLPNAGRTPIYAPPVTAYVQIQAAAQSDLKKLEGMNLQSVDTTIYMNGALSGAIRILAKGGDLIFANNRYWLVVGVLEKWPDWCKVAVTMQNETQPPEIA